MANYFFSSESVSEGHPDKVADQISDAVLDALIALDSNSKVAVETMVTTNTIVVAGEVNAKKEALEKINFEKIARGVVKRIGYTKREYNFDHENARFINLIHGQSPDINQGVERTKPEEQGAGDQGIMFGYATNETSRFIPLTLDLSHALLKELADIRREAKFFTYVNENGDKVSYLRPDAKSQITLEYDENGKPLKVDTMVVSTQHDDFIKPKAGQSQLDADIAMQKQIEKDVREILIPRVEKLDDKFKAILASGDYKLLVNPTGKFVVGGPDGDTGLTGRKIIVDTYGGRGAHGGGAFSGKDPSKVDRSAAYAARHLAKNIVAAGLADEALVQLAYAIGVAQPMNLYINTNGTNHTGMSDAEMSKLIQNSKEFDFSPYGICTRLKLRNPVYEATASYGHVGRNPHNEVCNGKDVELFTWEKTDKVDTLKKLFKM